MGVAETCQATSARSAPSLATRKLGLIAHPSMDQWLFHLETKPTAPPGCARSAAGVQLAAAGAAQVVVRLAAAGGGGTGGGCWTPRTQDTGCFGCRLRVQASGPGFGARERRCWSRTRAALGGVPWAWWDPRPSAAALGRAAGLGLVTDAQSRLCPRRWLRRRSSWRGASPWTCAAPPAEDPGKGFGSGLG